MHLGLNRCLHSIVVGKPQQKIWQFWATIQRTGWNKHYFYSIKKKEKTWGNACERFFGVIFNNKETLTRTPTHQLNQRRLTLKRRRCSFVDKCRLLHWRKALTLTLNYFSTFLTLKAAPTRRRYLSRLRCGRGVASFARAGDQRASRRRSVLCTERVRCALTDL